MAVGLELVKIGDLSILLKTAYCSPICLLCTAVEISVAAHDTTGGMETKILEAAVIARLGIDVYITKAGTEHSLRALKGDVSSDSEDWLGTIIRSSK